MISSRQNIADDISTVPSVQPFSIAPNLRGRFVAFGKFLLFAMVFYGLLRLFTLATGTLSLSGIGWQALAGNLCVAAAALFTTALFARFEKRAVGIYGLGRQNKARLGLTGLVAGLILLTALLIVLSVVSSFRFGALTDDLLRALEFGLLYAALFAAVALAEETLWRGYALVNLSQSISFWPAAILLGIIFGVSHLNHAQENMLGILFATLFGVVLAWSFRQTGSLWFALGVHAGWDYALSFIYGVPDSGVILPGALMRPQMGGPEWLTGGRAGPEGSVLMVLVLAALGFLIYRLPHSLPKVKALSGD